MGSRVLSLWLPYLATDRITRDQRRSEKGEGPLSTFSRTGGCYRLADLCPLAERSGLKPGITLDDARTHAPGLTALPRDEKADRHLLDTLKVWCERYTPWVAVDRSFNGGLGYALWLDMANAAHLFGGEAHLLTDLLGRLSDQGIHAKAAIADHPGTAWAMARFGTGKQQILPVNGARVALASLPVAALRLTDEQALSLMEQGMDRIDALYPLPRQVLEARFGRGIVTRLDQALGLIDEPIASDAPLPAQQARLIFADPVMTIDALRPSIQRLVRQLSVGLEAAGLGARRLTLALYRIDGSPVTLSIGGDRPSRQTHRLSRLLIEKADDVDPGFGIERAILDAVEIEPLLPETIAWRGLGTNGADPIRDLAHKVLMPSRRERGRAMSACCSTVNRSAHDPAIPVVAASGRSAAALKLMPVPDEEPVAQQQPSRPLRLLRRPEPIEAVAPLPDEPPILFRWRHELHRIVRAQGPERVAPDWWRIPGHEQPSISHEIMSKMEEERRLRDYFAVEDSDGDRFWLFREGLYRSSQATLPRWYLHGLFG